MKLNSTSLCVRTASSTALPLVGKYGPEFCAPCRTEVESHRQILSGRRPENAPDARRFRGALSTFRSDTFHMENILVSAQANQESGGKEAGIRRQKSGVRKRDTGNGDRLISPIFSRTNVAEEKTQNRSDNSDQKSI